jgi:hypothetical protein
VAEVLGYPHTDSDGEVAAALSLVVTPANTLKTSTLREQLPADARVGAGPDPLRH